ncbi:unnamed protein product, partial [Mycena citricolor]
AAPDSRRGSRPGRGAATASARARAARRASIRQSESALRKGLRVVGLPGENIIGGGTKEMWARASRNLSGWYVEGGVDIRSASTKRRRDGESKVQPKRGSRITLPSHNARADCHSG